MALHHCRIETPACWSLASTLHNPAAECAGYYQGGLGPDHNMFANCTYNHESGACARELITCACHGTGRFRLITRKL